VLGDVARQPERLGASRSSQTQRPLCARAPPSALARSRRHRVPEAIGAARDALDLARRQAERLAELADRAARAKARKGRDERRAVAAVALVDAADQDLADVAREVEVDVRQRGQLGVEEAPHREAAGERVDVREAGQVADDRGDRGAASAARRQQRARRVGAADLGGDLARELEDLVVQQEEAGQRERSITASSCSSRARASRSATPAVALAQARAAELAPGVAGGLVLDAGVAVAEVAGEVEVAAARRARALGDRLGMVAKRACHRRRGGEHVLLLGRRSGSLDSSVRWWRSATKASCSGTRAAVGVDVAGRHAAQSQARGERGERALRARSPARNGRCSSTRRRSGRRPRAAGARREVVHAVLRAAGQADQPLGVLADGLERDRRGRRLARAFAGVGVGERQQAAEACASRARWRPAA
jgi:hypothetical protein